MPIIKKHQTLLDFVTQHTGSAEALFDVAELNGIAAVTDDIAPGTELKVIEKNKNVIRYFLVNGLDIAGSEELNSDADFISLVVDTGVKPDGFIRLGERQTLIDIAMQECGDALKIFEIAELNGIGITDDLPQGYPLLIPDVEPDKLLVISAFGNTKPASADIDDVLNTVLDGIDYWIIEEDFIVQEN